MDNLITVENGEPMTTSLKIAEAFNKQHGHVIRDIRKRQNEYKKELESGSPDLDREILVFEELAYIDERGKEQVMFKLNKNAMVFTVNKWTSPKATQVQLYYIDAFDTMQKQLERQAQQQFFIPETVEQQYKREQLAIRKQESENAKSREGRALLKLTKNDPALVKQIVPQLFAGLLGADTVKQIELMKPQYIYSASAIGKKLGLEPYTVGSLAQELGLKATREEGANQFTKNTEVPLGDGTVKSTWRYSEEAYQAMKEALEA